MKTRRINDPSNASRIVGLAVLALALAGLLPAPAGADDLPDVETIMARSIEALGGEEALSRLHNNRSTGTFAVPSMGIEASMTVLAASPRLSLATIESAATGTLQEGCDGEVCWATSLMGGTQIKEGDERALSLRRATFIPELHWRSLYDSVEVVGITEIEGRPCYHVVMTPTEGEKLHTYYGTSDYLARKLETQVDTQMGTIRSEIYPGDYRDVDGVLVPFTARTVLMGGAQEMSIALTDVEFNVELPADAFALPAEVQELLQD